LFLLQSLGRQWFILWRFGATDSCRTGIKMARMGICDAQRTHTCHCRYGTAIRGDDDIARHDGDGIDDAAHD
jgi:hypothetical protein